MKMRHVLLIVVCLMLALVPASAKKEKKGKEGTPEEEAGKLSSATFEGLKFRGIGPALMSGRIADIAIHPENQSVWYVAVGSGGVWKTTNAGTSWTSIFDAQPSYSIGCLAIDAAHPDTVWVGTGENVGGRHVSYGDGVYRSRDGGASWEQMGLAASEHIGNIVIDPRDSNTVYVAAQGPLWSQGGDRGLFKTTDGGQTWEKLLGDDEYTGVNEVVLDSTRPDTLYAATHQRFRNVAALINGGPGSGIHKSTDGGKTWRKLAQGLPEEDMGKIGLALSPQDPDVLYATIELAHRKGGFYRSANGGESWSKQNDYISGGTGPHYYMEIFASPHAFDHVYQMDVRMRVTRDGGKTFERVPSKHKHSDNHALAFDPNDPNYLLSGNDGGLYESRDLGENWRFVANLPVTQFYKVSVDYDEPFYNVVGGTQDNNTQYGPSRTDNVHGIRNSDWQITLFGDGHQPAIDPTNPDIIYSEWQQGNLVRFDRKTGEIVYIKPQPAEGESSERFNWDSPILISPHDPKTLFFASQRVWRSDDRGDSWRPISGDLSRGTDRLVRPMMGRVWSFDAVWDLLAMSVYGTVTSLAQSPKNAELIYAGTDDGLIHVSEDGGSSWRKIDSLPGVADVFFVNDIKADLYDENTVYVAVDQHKTGDFEPYLYRSDDRGKTWRSIRGDLPERHLVWRLVQDHVKPELLFVGTEFGVFFSIDAGERWIELTGGVPNIAFRDLVIQTRENDLVGATFGRGFWILDDYAPLRHVTEASLEQEAQLFPVREAKWYIQRRPLGGGAKASQGEAYFTAKNPPFGAVFTYQLGEGYSTRKEDRQEAETKIKEQGGDTPTPGWDALQDEQLEEQPEIVLSVRDSGGDLVRRLTGPAKSGFHRVTWDLRDPSSRPWSPPQPRPDFDRRNRGGALVLPGTYSVSLAKRVDGKLVDLGQSQTFEVTPLRDGGVLPGASLEVRTTFARRLAKIQGAVSAAGRLIDETTKRVEAMQEVMLRSKLDNPTLEDRARELERRLKLIEERIGGSDVRDSANDPGPVSIQGRLFVASIGTNNSTYGPTPTHREAIGIAERQYAQLKQDLDGITRKDVPDLEAALAAAGAPWSPGRDIPEVD